MSEFNPFSASQEAPEYAPEAVEETAAGSRKTVLAVGALAALAVGAGAFLFLGGGGEEEDFTIQRAARAAAPAEAAAAPAALKLPAASKLTLGRNPFRALFVEPAAAAAAPTTNVGAPQVPTTPVVVVDGGGQAPAQPVYQPAPFQPGPAQPAPAAKAAPAPAPAQSTVALKSVAAGKDGANPTATFDYDGKIVSGAPGDVMAGKLLVISIQRDSIGGWFANLQLGDGSPFEVHERQRVVVQ